MTKLMARRAPFGHLGSGGFGPYPTKSRSGSHAMIFSLFLVAPVMHGHTRHGHEFLVAGGTIAPHQHGKARRTIKHRQPVMPNIHAIGDALIRRGKDGDGAGDMSPARGGMRTNDDHPT